MYQSWNQEEVEQSLATVLEDAKFAAAPQMSAFLKFVVQQTLSGKADRIKAYTVAVDALGKPATFDPQNDPSVRVLAKRLRDTLTAYYERTTDHKVILLLKSGSYVPNFVTPEEWRAVMNKPTGNVTHLPNMVNRDERTTNAALLNDEKEKFAERGKISGDTLETAFGLANNNPPKPQ